MATGRTRYIVAREVRKVAAYLRVSTEDQARSGLGLTDQRQRCFGMAAAKGWPEPIVYADEGISGTRSADRRPALHRLLMDVCAGQLDAVIVFSLDRLGRRTRLVLNLVETFGEHNTEFVSCKETLDTSTPQGQFVLTMFAALSQLERDLIAERTKAALAVKGRTGGEMGGTVPYGYMRTEDGPMIDLGDAQTVRRIFMWRRTAHSLRTIAAMLNADDVEGPRGGRWWATSVREVLQNEAAYKGGKRGASEVRWPKILVR